VSNAIRYTEQGSVSIECDQVENELIIAVTDTGAGIPLDQQDDIFEEYYQLGNDARERKKGLGLGLSIVRQIARLLDYPLKVASEVDVGSIFSVVVPLTQEMEVGESSINDEFLETEQGVIVTSETSATEEVQESSIERPRVVLLVDDDESVLNSTARLLKVFRMDVHIALSGDLALELITNGLQPDVLVSDFRLPDYDGIDLISKARAALKYEVAAIIMSGDTSAEKIKNARFPKYISLNKPVDPQTLKSLIESGLEDT